MRVTATKIKAVVMRLLPLQKYTCPLCHGSLRATSKRQPVLDHCHTTGRIRDVLCRNCNGMEGKVFNLARRSKGKLTEKVWLANVVRYWHRHEQNQHGLVHHTYKTPEDKRLAANAKARKRRAQQKAMKT